MARMARRNPVGRLTERDLEVLRWVGQGGVASLGQIACRFWPGKRAQTALDRVRQLVKAGYLEIHVYDAGGTWGIGNEDNERDANNERVFTLTEGGSLLFSPSERQLFYIDLPSLAEVRQQILAQEAYIRLEAQLSEQGAELVGWKSERVIRAGTLTLYRRDRQQMHTPMQLDIPDAEATVRMAGGELQILCIEVDGAYYGKMLCQKAASLAKAGHPVIWVCTQARACCVQQAIAEYPNIQLLIL